MTYIAVFKHFFISSFGAISLKVITIIGYAYLLLGCSADDIGIWYLFNCFMYLITVISAAGFPQILKYEYIPRTAHERSLLIGRLLRCYSTISIPIVLGCLMLLLMSSTSIQPLIIICCFTSSIAHLISDMCYAIWRLESRSKRIVMIQALGTSITLCMSWLLIYAGHTPLLSLIISSTLACIAVASTCLYHILKEHRVTSLQKNGALGELYRMGVAFLPYLLFSWSLLNVPRLVLSYTRTLTDVALYSLLSSCFICIELFLIEPLQTSYIPWQLHNLTTQSSDYWALERQNILVLITLTLLIALGATIGTVLLTIPLIHSAIPAYAHQLFTYIPFIALYACLALAVHFQAIYLQHKNLKNFVALTQLTTSSLALAITLLTITKLSFMGFIYGQLLGQTMCLSILTIKKYYLLTSSTAINNGNS